MVANAKLKKRPQTGIVMAGGGARGAYEVGVLLFIRERLSKRLGYDIPLDVLAGTSVGAINASFTAATLEDPKNQIQRLRENWNTLRVDYLMSLDLQDLWQAGKLLIGPRQLEEQITGSRHGGLINTSGLEKFVSRSTPWRGISNNIRNGNLRALAVSATHVGSGHSVVFSQTQKDIEPGWSSNPFVKHNKARIGPRHVLASAAIPMFFSAVKINREYYTDGGLRQNTPMSPAIHLGADRLLVISLRHISSKEELEQQHSSAYPRPLFLFGKAMDALLLDHTEYDLDRMERLNVILKAGRAVYGDEFNSKLNEEMIDIRGKGALRALDAVHVRPSQDIGLLAADFISSGRADIRNRFVAKILNYFVDAGEGAQSDLPSYLLFDGKFAELLIELGYEDAAVQEDQLAELFSIYQESGKGIKSVK